MIPTTFVFGAGTSIPFGFPSGFELLRKIGSHSSEIERTSRLNIALNSCIPEYDRHTAKQFIIDARDGGFSSIDRLVQEQPHYDHYARALISHIILIFERNCFGNVISKNEPHAKDNAMLHLWNMFSGSTKRDKPFH